jgi:hypothetical protein
MVYQKECQDFKHLQLRNENRHDDVGFEVLTVVVMKSSIF